MRDTDGIAAQFNHTIDLDEHDQCEILEIVLDRTKEKYGRTLQLFDRYVQTISLCVYISLPHLGLRAYILRQSHLQMPEPTKDSSNGLRSKWKGGLIKKTINRFRNPSRILEDILKPDGLEIAHIISLPSCQQLWKRYMVKTDFYVTEFNDLLVDPHGFEKKTRSPRWRNGQGMFYR